MRAIKSNAAPEHSCTVCSLSYVEILIVLVLASFLKVSESVTTPVTVNFAKLADPPLLKKFGIYNSGLIPQQRYTPEILTSMGTLKAASFRADLSIGKQGAGFTDLMALDFSSIDLDPTFNFSLIDNLVQGLQAQKVPPYWSLTYNPTQFQPVCQSGLGSDACNGTVSTCRGFEHLNNIPGTNNYSCIPSGNSNLDDCWKCPPKIDEEDSYLEWSRMVKGFHQHLLDMGISPIYEEQWNEPDLTEYYNPTVSSYKGSNVDYNNAYIACGEALQSIDPDLMYGGIAAANQIPRNPKYPLQPTGEDTLLAAAELGLQMDFFSYHSITTSPGMDQIGLTVGRAQASREVLSSQDLLNITGDINPFDTTEVHCTEFFPNATTEALTVAFSSSPYLATVLLEAWDCFLEERDLAMVSWAQYMDIFDTDDQIGLVSFQGNPRPAWWAFKWYSELPAERVRLSIQSPFVRGMASISTRTCTGGVLLWNVPTPQNLQNPTNTTLAVHLQNIPFAVFDLEVYIIDDKLHPIRGYTYAPAITYLNQSPDVNGGFLWPPEEYSGVKMPVNGTIYIKILPSASACQLTHGTGNALLAFNITRTHNYYGQRPLRTSLYAHFHQHDWTAYLGMGGEVSGYAITGATIKANSQRFQALNISMNLYDGTIVEGGIAGVRIDFATKSAYGQASRFQQPNSYFFYQNGTQPCSLDYLASKYAASQMPILDLSYNAPPLPPQDATHHANGSSSVMFATQNALTYPSRNLRSNALQDVCGQNDQNYAQIPDLWGTKQPVQGEKFLAVNLENFAIDPDVLAPEDWDGRALLLFVMKDGSPGTKVQVFVTGQS